MSNSQILLPLASRLVTGPKEKELMGLESLFGKADRKFIRDISRGLFESGFDIYLGGEIVQNVFSDWLKPYSFIDIFAVTKIENNRLYKIECLKDRREWVHFGWVIPKIVGFQTIDVKHGSEFNVDFVSCSDECTQFKLTAGIYFASEGKPSTINLYFVSSLKDFKVIL